METETETETEKIQNELSLAFNPLEKIVGDENPKGISKAPEESPTKKNSPKKINSNRPSGETESQFEEGKLVVDENRPEDRKRNSAKRYVFIDLILNNGF